jgi:hypothetical protein
MNWRPRTDITGRVQLSSAVARAQPQAALVEPHRAPAAMGDFPQPSDRVELQVALPEDEAAGVADRLDVHPSLGEEPAPGDGLARRPPGARPVHNPG